MNEPEKLIFTPAQQRELHYLFGSLPNAGTAALRSPISFDDLVENLRRYNTYLERQRKFDVEERKELFALRRQQAAIREFLGVGYDGRE